MRHSGSLTAMADSTPELTQEQIDDFLATVRLPLVTDAASRAYALSTAAFGALLGVLAGSTWAMHGDTWSGLLWGALQVVYLGGLVALVTWRRRATRSPSTGSRSIEIKGVVVSAVLAFSIVMWVTLGGAPVVGPLAGLGAGLLTAAPSFVAAYRIAPTAFVPDSR